MHLVDTDGKGVQSIAARSITVNDQEYPVDIIIWSTGYGNPLTESLAGKADIIVRGKDGKEMEKLNQTMDLKLLHGITGYGFPNLFLLSLGQAGVGVNQVQRIGDQATHFANMIAEAEKQVGKENKVIIEPTEEACDKWQDELASASHLTAAILACTPGYFTLEGDAPHIPKEALPKLGRTGLYGQGYLKYARILDEWRADGQMEGMNIASAA